MELIPTATLSVQAASSDPADFNVTIYQPVASDLRAQVDVLTMDYTACGVTTYVPTYQLTGSTTTLAISGTTARVAFPTGPQRYVIKCSVDCFIQQGDSTVNAVVASSFPLAAMQEFIVYWNGVRTTTQYIAAITSGAAGTLYIYPLVAG